MTPPARSDGLATIGLEVHVQLATVHKLFCADTTTAAEPNTHVCPVCLGLPGALPVLNRAAVELALRAAVGLECTIPPRSVFERKSYFYPDLPKGYQITQQDAPLATGGRLEFRCERRTIAVGIRRVHLEEDAGRLLHDRFEDRTAVDLNRAGVPLIEIVSEPELGTPGEARAFLTRLRQTLRYLGVSECDMENGTLRVDANVSLATPDAGARVEIKNLNSFAHVEAALKHEVRRQQEEHGAGRRVRNETRSWDAAAGVTRLLRAKEDAHDYRFMREPDLPPLDVPPELVARVRDELPELPAARERRYAAAYDLPAYDIGVLTADVTLGDYFEAVADASGDARDAAKWVLGPVMAWLNRSGSDVQDVPVAPQRLAELMQLVAAGRVSRTAARRLFDQLTRTDERPAALLERSGLAQISDDARLSGWIRDIIARYPEEAARFRAGDRRLKAFLMGRIMQQSGGAADPARAARLLEEHLDA